MRQNEEELQERKEQRQSLCKVEGTESKSSGNVKGLSPFHTTLDKLESGISACDRPILVSLT